jgi:hypothetical protein
VTSIIRSESQKQDILALGATPLVVSVVDATVSTWVPILKNSDVVYYGASEGRAKGEDREERLRKVDFEGAQKVYDAIAQLSEGPERKKPRLVVLGAVDIRDPEKPFPDYYVCNIRLTLRPCSLMLSAGRRRQENFF